VTVFETEAESPVSTAEETVAETAIETFAETVAESPSRRLDFRTLCDPLDLIYFFSPFLQVFLVMVFET
jgi:hypothetical protein